MTIQMWSDMSVLVGGLELAGLGKEVRVATECAPLDKTNMASGGYTELLGGNKSGSVDLVLMQDRADNGLDELAWSYLGVADVPKSIVTNSADGSTCYLMRGIVLGYDAIDGAAGELAMTRIAGRNSTGGVVRGQLIHPGSAARTSSGTGTGRQIGAVVAGKSLYAALHVLTSTGTTPSLTVKVQSDDNGSFTTATDRITFTAETDATAHYQWGSVAGAITDDYWRITYTISGTNPSFSFAVTAGIL